MASYLTETGLTKLVTNIKALFASHVTNMNNPHKVTKTQLGLDSVENKSSETIRNEITLENITSALGYTPSSSSINTANTDGFVLKGGEYPNRVWKTDQNGNPGWREDSSIEVDTSLSTASTNPVENRVVTVELNNKVSTTRTINGKGLTTNIVLNAADVGADEIGAADTAYNTAKAYTDEKTLNSVKERISVLEPTTQQNGEYWLQEY